MLPAVLEPTRIGALEAIDRLLGVADREQRADTVGARAVPGRELLRDQTEDAPLFRVGVLRFVDEDMVDAPVELVEDPGGGVALQQQQRLADEVVEIEGAEPGLGLRDAAPDRTREREQGLRP